MNDGPGRLRKKKNPDFIFFRTGDFVAIEGEVGMLWPMTQFVYGRPSLPRHINIVIISIGALAALSGMGHESDGAVTAVET